MGLFSLDSPLMQFLSKVADLLLLNMLALLCCIPIVTIGASLTALNYMALKIARNEECYIARGFFKSFKENFKQATLIWLLLLLVIVVLAADFWIMGSSGAEFSVVIRTIITAAAVMVLFTSMYVFPMLARFDNTIPRTIKNAFLASIMQLPKTVLMVIFYMLPLVVLLFFYQIAPLAFFFALSVPAFLSAKLYSKLFKKLEDQIQAVDEPVEETGEDERIFRDELDESLFGEDSTN